MINELNFATLSNEQSYPLLLNLIGGIHRYNQSSECRILVYNLGLNDIQKDELKNINGISIIDVSGENLYEFVKTQSLAFFNNVLYLNLDTNIVGNLSSVFNHIYTNNLGFTDVTDLDNTIISDVVQFNSNLLYHTFKKNVDKIRRKYVVSCITGIGKLSKYEKFIDNYFSNIQSQDLFEQIEFVIVYSEWSSKFDTYKHLTNVKFIKENEQLGVYNAWNIGIQNASAEYVTNWNIDDIRFKENCRMKYELLNSNEDVDLVYSYWITSNPEELQNGLDLSTKRAFAFPDNFHLYTHVTCMAGPDPMWRKSYHTFHGYFDYENFSIIGDWEMWVRMSKDGLIMKLIPQPLCIYVDHSDTVSNSDGSKTEEQKKKLKEKYNI
jgi:hypothetical protein